MADDGFNGATISWGAASQLPLRSIRYSASAAKVDITGCADTVKTYVGGILDAEVTLEVVGGTAITVGATAALVIAFGAATVDTAVGDDSNLWICTGIETGGDLDGEVTTSLTVVPTTPTA